jgi:urease accessory protein UreH
VDSSGSPVRAVGRHARLEATFARRCGRTVLAHAYVEPPFRIGRTFSIDDAAYVIVVCSGPGIFGGDELIQHVHLESGARVFLTSQSALQVHPSTFAQPALLRQHYVVESDAELHCHWHPVIPFADAWLDQRFELQIAEGARLYWSDALMSGRAARGERWRFRELAHQLRLDMSGALKYQERYRLAPARSCESHLAPESSSGCGLARDPTRRWLAGDVDYLGTALVSHDNVSATHAEELQQEVDRLAGVGVRGAVDLVEAGLIVGRFMSRDGASFSHLRAASRAFALASIFNCTGPDRAVFAK